MCICYTCLSAREAAEPRPKPGLASSTLTFAVCSEVIKLCHSIPVKSVENDKVAGSCLSEPLNEDHPEDTTEEEQAAGAPGEDNVCDTAESANVKSEPASASDADKDVDAKLTGDAEQEDAEDASKVPEQVTVDSEGKGDAVKAVSDNAGEGESECAVDTEMVFKAEGEEDEETKTEEQAADSASAVKESSSVEGDQKKRFVVFCLLEQTWLSLLHWLLC